MFGAFRMSLPRLIELGYSEGTRLKQNAELILVVPDRRVQRRSGAQNQIYASFYTAKSGLTVA